jgi:large subunit ribosomal protein L9
MWSKQNAEANGFRAKLNQSKAIESRFVSEMASMISKFMKVIFTNHVSGVATRGDIKRVKPGFFRNFLLPNGKAVLATEPLIKEWEERRKHMLIEKEQLKAKFEETKRRLSDTKLRIEKKVTAKGTLYGGVKPADIAKAVRAQYSMEIPEEAVVIEKAIKAVGAYEVRLNLGEGVETVLPVEVVEKK